MGGDSYTLNPIMTICIAALCAGGKSCVVAADRQITVGALSLEFEHADKKFEDIVSGCVVMSSGDALLASEVIERAKSALGGGSYRVLQVAEGLRDVYIATHLRRAESVILQPRGFTLKEFKERGGQQIPPQVYLGIDQQIFNFGIGVVEFLVAGSDSSGAHLFRVHYNGVLGGDWLEWCDRLGFRAIGSGSPHASISLAIENQNRSLSVAETVYNVYAAKRNSEVAPGVGIATDMVVMTSEKVETITPDRMEKLAKVREKNRQNRPGKTELEAI